MTQQDGGDPGSGGEGDVGGTPPTPDQDQAEAEVLDDDADEIDEYLAEEGQGGLYVYSPPEAGETPDTLDPADQAQQAPAEEDYDPRERPRAISPPGIHRVRQGESLPSIGELYRMDWRTIWKDSHNQQLRDTRSPGILHPGDKVYIPARQCRTENHATDSRHRFCYKRPKVWLRLVLKDEEGAPRSGLQYALHIGGVPRPYEGETDPSGLIMEQIPAGSTTGALVLQDPAQPTEAPEIYELYIQCLDPAGRGSGAQARLNNLGFRVGVVDGADSDQTEAAIRVFQIERGLPVTGKLDDATRGALLKEHGA